MNRLRERKKQRRRYLWKKGNVYGRRVIATSLMWIAVDATVISLLITLAAIPVIAVVGVVAAVIWFVVGAVLTLCCGGFAMWCCSAVERVEEEVVQLGYVPPVIPANLPPEEILVRGAVQPDDPQETLLRAAQSDEMKAEELLRAETGLRTP